MAKKNVKVGDKILGVALVIILLGFIYSMFTDNSSKNSNQYETKKSQLSNASKKSTSSPTTNITGAFGIKFGEKSSKLKIKTRRHLDGFKAPAYIVIPPKKVKFWNRYDVAVTPITKRVFTIIGTKAPLTKEGCEANLEAVASIIEKSTE